MSGFFHDIARASLPVTIVLLGLAAGAAAVLRSQVDDIDLRRMATEYRDPLSTWCLAAVGVHTVALVLAGDAGGMGLAVALLIAAGAVLVRNVEPVALAAPTAVAEPAPGPAPVVAPEPEPEPVEPPRPVRPSEGSLWASRPVDRGAGDTGLWRREPAG
jgi:hypothetical protein